MRNFFYHLPKNVARCFSGRYLPWHLLAIALTCLIVVSGFDWAYFIFFRDTAVYSFFFPATAIIGGLMPIIFPLALLAAAQKNARIKNAAFALGQTGIIGIVVSSLYKILTGRVPPEFASGFYKAVAAAHIPIEFINTHPLKDVSRMFQFGFLRGGIFWGWPSSHATIAFAMAATLMMLYPKNKKMACLAIGYAAYIGFGVSISIHWFSDAVAGAIIGTVIGIVVGKSFRNRYVLRK